MMLTIHGLPLAVKYHDLKSVIKEKCNISDYILDNLVSEGDGTKKVRIGVADESEGSYLIKCLHGFRMGGNILRVLPVGKPAQGNPQNFDQRGDYPPRNDYHNQSGPNYGRPMDHTSHPDMMRNEPQRQDPWGSGNNQWGPNQGSHQMSQPPMQGNSYNNYQQPPLNAPYNQPNTQQPTSGLGISTYDLRDHYQGRGPPNQSFNDIPAIPDQGRRADVRPHVLRSVEIIDEPIGRPHPDYHPAPRQKPITIMKDNFQGPQYNMDRPIQPSYQGQGQNIQGHSGGGHQAQGSQAPAQATPWTQTIQPEKAPYGKPSPNFDRKYPEPDKRPMLGKPESQTMHEPFSKGYGPGKAGPRFSPRRDVSDPGRRLPSPGRRMASPGRRMPSPGRRISPGRRLPSPGRRMPSPGRRMPSPGKRISPGRRMPSPGRRLSPGRRAGSPPHKRHDSPERYSPRRHVDKLGDKYNDRAPKDVRPAYDPQAANQAMYSGGYRPSLQDNVQYPTPGARQPEQHTSPWQDKTFPAKKDDDRRMPKFEPRIDEGKRSPRKSRSPIRRDRSPIRDRFKKHSPSPRSPRRSWALEKRRSPDIRDAPPPPAWPGQPRDEQAFRRFPERDEPEKKHVPVWEGRRPEDERRFDTPLKVRTDLVARSHQDPSPRGFKPDDRFAAREPKFESREPKFESREPKFETRQPKFESRDHKFEQRDPKFEPRDPKFMPRATKFDQREPVFEPREEFRRDDMPKRHERDFREPQRSTDDIRSGRPDHRREEFIRDDFRREEERKVPKVTESFNKEFDDVYKRAQELNKRAEELRKRSLERRSLEFNSRDREPKEFDKNFDRRDDRADFRAGREPDWKIDTKRNVISPTLKAKREKAVDELANKIVDKHGSHFTGDIKRRILEEMKIVIGKSMHEMFGYNDVSFIEMVIKFNAKYNAKAEARMFDTVMQSLPSQLRSLKRSANESARAEEVPRKTSRFSDNTDLNRDIKAQAGNATYIPDWKPNSPSPPTPVAVAQQVVLQPQRVNLPPPTVHIPNPMLMSQFNMVQHMGMMVQQPVMVPAPTYAPYKETTHPEPTPTFQANEKYADKSPKDDCYNLYLCKDDFEPYSDNQAEYLKKFLVSQLIKASQTSQGWSPDFTLKGLQSLFRFEIETRDQATKDWLLNLDFSEFQLFNVLVYTKEEMWYERAAVWLPGHSRCRNIEPLTKLKLQNRQLKGVNIGKWKFVKKIITAKGTRIYVDMPPSSARALEKHKMLLSYELQKVSVFLKAVAVDKEVFDSGLRVPSITDQADIAAAAQNSPMPSLGQDPNIIKICLKGNKALSVEQARKIKDMVIYHIFKHHQDRPNDSFKTDFVKFGFCLPGYFGVLPENSESKRWLMSLNIGKLNRHAVVVLGADEATTKFIKMAVILTMENSRNMALVLERLKQSNQGVKGLNFSMWKPVSIYTSRDRHNNNKAVFEIEMDLESVETLMKKLSYKLDYVFDDRRHELHTVTVRYEHSDSRRLEELVKKLKSEMNDSYDVANMDIASSDDDDDIVYVGEVNR